jgi:Helix-turn-helix domain
MSEATESAIRRMLVARSMGRLPAGLADDVVALLSQQQGDVGTMRQKQAAQFLGVSVRTLRAWHARGIGPPRQRVGRVSMYARGALENWLRHSNSGT